MHFWGLSCPVCGTQSQQLEQNNSAPLYCPSPWLSAALAFSPCLSESPWVIVSDSVFQLFSFCFSLICLLHVLFLSLFLPLSFSLSCFSAIPFSLFLGLSVVLHVKCLELHLSYRDYLKKLLPSLPLSFLFFFTISFPFLFHSLPNWTQSKTGIYFSGFLVFTE